MSQAPTALKGAWSDGEKLALLLSIIKSNGSGAAPKWSNGIAVPQGRTLQASQKMYGEILKGAAARVQMTAGDAVTPSGKRPRAGGAGAFRATAVAAVARKANDDDDDDDGGDHDGGDHDDDAGQSSKRRKTAVTAAARKPKKVTAKKVKKSLALVEQEGDDDESVAAGEGADKKVAVKVEGRGEEGEEEGF